MRRSWFSTLQPWLLIGVTVGALCVGAVAYGQGTDCSLEQDHEARVECYLSELLDSHRELVGVSSLVGEALPALMVLGAAWIAVALVRAPRLR